MQTEAAITTESRPKRRTRYSRKKIRTTIMIEEVLSRQAKRVAAAQDISFNRYLTGLIRKDMEAAGQNQKP